MGCLYKRGRVWWLKYSRDGRAYFESSGSKKHEDAKRLLRLREGDIEKGVPVTPKIGRLRFDEAVDDVKAEYKANGRKSLDVVEGRVRVHLTPFFAGKRMSVITTAHVRTYSNRRLAEGAAPATVNRELAILKRAYSLAIQGGTLSVRPHIPMLREQNVRIGFFDRQQLDAVLAHLPDTLTPMLRFAYCTGWRIPSEVLTIQWRQVDFEAGTVRLEVGTTKNDRGREFPFDVFPELHELLLQQRELTRHVEQQRGQIIPWVFHRSGRRIRDFSKAWQSACQAAGVPGRIPHDFRRSAVRNLVRAGVSDKVAMQLTGHKTRSVFDRYDIVSGADLREGVAKLATVTKRVTAEQSGAMERLSQWS